MISIWIGGFVLGFGIGGILFGMITSYNTRKTCKEDEKMRRYEEIANITRLHKRKING